MFHFGIIDKAKSDILHLMKKQIIVAFKACDGFGDTMAIFGMPKAKKMKARIPKREHSLKINRNIERLTFFCLKTSKHSS